MNSPCFQIFLPGQFQITRGSAADYSELARFHYRPGRPATWAGIWIIQYETRLIAVGVLSYPTINSNARDAALDLHRLTRPARPARLAFINANIRTISRVIVHPQFRGLGLASRLVQRICHDCPTRWTEACAAMARIHPFFEKGGMTRLGGESKAYFLHDKSCRSECRP